MSPRDFRHSRVNRDRRDQAFCRAVIAIAERRRIDPSCRCTSAADPSCPAHGIAASNARENEYWKRVGGHPDAGEIDGPDEEALDAARCPHCLKAACPGDCPQYYEDLQDVSKKGMARTKAK